MLAHWSTVKPAYRVTLEDGTKLIASGDHRFLTDRGWKHVTGRRAGPGPAPVPHHNNKLMGFGGFAEPPKDSIDYRRGYLCGMIRGDAHFGSYVHALPARFHRFRLALADEEALARTREYLVDLRGPHDRVRFLRRDAQRGVRCGPSAAVSRSDLEPSSTRSGGRLPVPGLAVRLPGGHLRRRGQLQPGVWRISNTDPEIIGWTTRALRALGFDYVLEAATKPNGLVVVRLRGGLKEVMRFFHTTDPAITRKRTIEGMAIKSDAKLRVAVDRAARP